LQISIEDPFHLYGEKVLVVDVDKVRKKYNAPATR